MNLTGFNNEQIEAINFIDGACCVIASAGSGKTAVLTCRIANLIENGIAPNNILAVTFTKKSSIEMKDRLRKIIGDVVEQVNLGTFHGICYKILRDEWELSQNPMKDFDLIKSYNQQTIIEKILPNLRKPIDWKPSQIISFISRQKSNLITSNDKLLLDINMEYMRDSLTILYKQYEEQKFNKNFIDYDDMLLLCYRMLIENPKILEKYKDMFKYILVDEFQDTNLLQDKIITLLAWEHKNIFIVGDDFQSIYGFRSAKVDLIINFGKKWNARIIPLDINYRSTKNIVEWSNKLISNNTNQYPKNVIANQGKYKDPVIIESCDEDEEAENISKEIMDLMIFEKYNPQDFSILYRTNAQSRALEEAMIRNKIPYVVLGSKSFYDRKEITEILAYLRLCNNLNDDISLKKIINKPSRYLGKEFIASLEHYAYEKNISLFEAINQNPLYKQHRKYNKALEFYNKMTKIANSSYNPSQKMKLIRDVFGYDEYLLKNVGEEDNSERIENLESLHVLMKRFSNFEDFFTYIDIISSKTSKSEDEIGKVKLMSIHRSKGLEYPVIFIAGTNNGIIPHKYSQTLPEVEEERRLMYVAMTRAKKLLYISYTENYHDKAAGASIFIDELND